MADKPKKFIRGHNALKAKSAPKPLSKVKELERKKVCFSCVYHQLQLAIILINIYICHNIRTIHQITRNFHKINVSMYIIIVHIGLCVCVL